MAQANRRVKGFKPFICNLGGQTAYEGKGSGYSIYQSKGMGSPPCCAAGGNATKSARCQCDQTHAVPTSKPYRIQRHASHASTATTGGVGHPPRHKGSPSELRVGCISCNGRQNSKGAASTASSLAQTIPHHMPRKRLRHAAFGPARGTLEIFARGDFTSAATMVVDVFVKSPSDAFPALPCRPNTRDISETSGSDECFNFLDTCLTECISTLCAPPTSPERVRSRQRDDQGGSACDAGAVRTPTGAYLRAAP